MQWLMAIETNDEPISLCRLIGIFRRKGVKIATLAIAARSGGYSLVALVETLESEVEHIFNYLRRTEGVRHVTYYQHEPSGNASFVFIDSDADSPGVARFLARFPESKLVFASHGKYLLEIPAEKRPPPSALGFGRPEFLPFACVKTTRGIRHPEMVGAQVS